MKAVQLLKRNLKAKRCHCRRICVSLAKNELESNLPIIWRGTSTPQPIDAAVMIELFHIGRPKHLSEILIQ